MKITYDIYSVYQKCLFKLVHTYVKKSRFSFDELMSEANMGFIKAVDTYNKNKAKFHTHLYITVNGRLSHYCNQKNVFNNFYENLNIEYQPGNTNPEQNASFKDLIDSMSTEAKEVINMVLNTPTEMIELVKEMTSNRQGKVHLYKSAVTRYLRTKGWHYYMINETYS